MSEPIRPGAAAEAGPGPVTHLIQVQCDMTSATLAVQRPQVSVKPGDTIVWSFIGIPEGWSPWIELRHSDNPEFAGPLLKLTQSAGGVWGTCREDWEETSPAAFEYRALIQRGFTSGWQGGGSILWSSPARLTVLPNGFGQEVVYTVTLAERDGKRQLLVEPLVRTLRPGDVAVWRFPDDLSSGEDAWRPRIDFFRYEGTGSVSNRYLGPFAALTVEPGLIRGTGNNGVDGLYFFEVALVSVGTGQIGWMSSGDPVVDNRGTVTTPDGR
jgi:hypothetical protein